MQTFPAAITAILESGRPILVRPAVKLVFPSGTRRYWQGLYDLSYEAATWQGIGRFLEIAPSKIEASNVAVEWSVTFSSIDPASVTDLLEEDFEGRVMELHELYFDPDTEVFAAGMLAMSLIMNSGPYVEGIDTATWTIHGESILARQRIPPNSRRTHEDHIARFPGDDAYIDVATIQKFTVKWPGDGWRPERSN